MPVPSPRNSIRIARGNYADLAANATEIGEGELCFAIDQDKFYSKSGGALVAVGGGTSLYSIAQLGDVDPSGVVDGQVLVYSSSEGKWVPADQTGGGGDVESVNGKTGAVVLVVSDLANDANYITAAEAPVQISDIPTNNNQLLNGAGYITAAEAPVQPGDLATVATTGSYNDLTDKPTIVPPPTPPVDSVNGQTGEVVLDAGDVGALASGDNISELTNNAGYITAAEAPVQPGDTFSGDYNDLTNKPSIPPAYDDSALDARVTQNESNIAQLETDLGNINGFSGDYNDLTNKPSIPSTPQDIGAATAAQGAKADSAIQPGTVNPVYFANQAAFPDATVNHGAVAHSHADGAMYFAHGGVWNKLANTSDLPVNVSELNNDAGYLTTETVNNIDLSSLPTLP